MDRLVILFCFVITVAAATAQPYGGGSGTPDDPYQIATAQGLIDLGTAPEDYRKHFVLISDIDLSGKTFARAVIAWDSLRPFRGTFDGQGCKILNMHIEGDSGLGLFGHLDHKAVVSGLGIEVSYVNGAGSYIGALAGDSAGTIANCYSTGQIIGKSGVGGLVGRLRRGFGTDRGVVSSSYSTCTVKGDQFVGGLVGSHSDGSMSLCYSTGTVTGDQYVGGLVGNDNGKGVTNCIWDVETSGQPFSGGGVGLSTYDMMDPIIVGLSGFAENPNWILHPHQDYPHLSWENTPGSLIPEPVDWIEGVGTEKDPFKLSQAEQLVIISKIPSLWQKHYILVNDIDLDGHVWHAAVIPEYAGSFNGNDCAIQNLDIQGTDSLGLFGCLTYRAKVFDLKLEAVNIKGTGNSVGSLTGENKGTIASSYSTGTVTGNQLVGGLVGSNTCSLSDCNSTCVVSGEQSIGGLTGENDGNITDSYSAGTVTGNQLVGGLVGSNAGSLSNCRSACVVSGEENVGGLVGSNKKDIAGSHSAGASTGYRFVGGLVGKNDRNGSVSNCYSTSVVKGENSAGHYYGSLHVGGLVGENYGSITEAYSTGAVRGEQNVGGLVGNNRKSIANSYSHSACFASGLGTVGGLAGRNTGNIISSSHELGVVNGNADVGGLVGANHGSIADCYGSGTVIGEDNVGGLIGSNELDGSVSNSQSAGTVSGRKNVGGLVGYSYRNGSISYSNSNCDILGEAVVGGLVGYNNTPITHSYSIGEVVGRHNVGGLVGYNYYNSIISSSHCASEVQGETNVGGLLGCNLGSVSNSSSNSEVIGKTDVGGLVGVNWTGSSIVSNSYSAGDTRGEVNVGGLIGDNNGSTSNCYSTGTVSGTSYVGGLVGENFNGVIAKCYSVGSVRGGDHIGGLVGDGKAQDSFWNKEKYGLDDSDGGTGLSTAEMQNIETYTSGGWDCASMDDDTTEIVWLIHDRYTYPFLSWQGTATSIIASRPSGSAGTPVDAVTLVFRSTMDPNSFSLQEDLVSFVGPQNPVATGFQWIAPMILEIQCEPLITSGRYKLQIGPQICDSNGNAMDQDEDSVSGEPTEDIYTFMFLIRGPEVEQFQSSTMQPVRSIRFEFSTDMDRNGFSPSEDIVTFSNEASDVTVNGFAWLNERTLILYTDLLYGSYQIVLSPKIPDVWGNLLDQDGDYVIGESIDDRYTASFTVEAHGTFTEDITLTPSRSYHIDGDLRIPSGVTLTVEAGTVIQSQNSSAAIIVDNGGQLIVRGTTQSPAIFTSDSGSKWQGIQVLSGGQATIENAEIRNATYGVNADFAGLDEVWVQLKSVKLCNNGCGIFVYKPNKHIIAENCLIADNDGAGVFIRASSDCTIRNCTIVGNGFNATKGWHKTGIHCGVSNLNIENTIVAFNANGLHHSGAPPQVFVDSSLFFNPDGHNVVWDSDPGEPDLGDNANQTTDPLFWDLQAHNYELSPGSPAIDRAHGYSHLSRDLLGRSRYDDFGMPNLGVGYPNYADLGAFEGQQATVAGDLAVSKVKILDPAFLSAGDPFIVEWTVSNVGSIDIDSSWEESLFLSQDAVFSQDDMPLDPVTHKEGLQANEKRTGFYEGAIPSGVMGPLYVLVRATADDSVFDPVLQNNLAASERPLCVDIPLLEISGSFSGDITYDQWSYLRLMGTQGDTIVLELEGSKDIQLYASRGVPPTLAESDFMGDEYGELRILNPADDIYYVGLYCPTHTVPGNRYQITARIGELNIRRVTPNVVGNTGTATIKIEGDSFDINAQARITSPGGMTFDADELWQDASTLFTTFDLGLLNASIGRYDLHITNPDGSQTGIVEAIDIEDGDAPEFVADLHMPNLTRPGRIITLKVEYRNPTNIDIPSPIVTLDAGNLEFQWQLPGNDSWITGSQFRFLALSSEGPATVLRPGQTNTVEIRARTPYQSGEFRIKVFSMGATPTDGSQGMIDWEKLDNDVRPDNILDDEWAVTSANLQSWIGSTWGEYARALRSVAEFWDFAGRHEVSIQKLFGVIFDRALGKSTAIVAGVVLDEQDSPKTGGKVYLWRDNATAIASTHTDVHGRFLFCGVRPGQYTLTFEHSGMFHTQSIVVDDPMSLHSVILRAHSLHIGKSSVGNVNGDLFAALQADVNLDISVTSNRSEQLEALREVLGWYVPSVFYQIRRMTEAGFLQFTSEAHRAEVEMYNPDSAGLDCDGLRQAYDRADRDTVIYHNKALALVQDYHSGLGQDISEIDDAVTELTLDTNRFGFKKIQKWVEFVIAKVVEGYVSISTGAHVSFWDYYNAVTDGDPGRAVLPAIYDAARSAVDQYAIQKGTDDLAKFLAIFPFAESLSSLFGDGARLWSELEDESNALFVETNNLKKMQHEVAQAAEAFENSQLVARSSLEGLQLRYQVCADDTLPSPVDDWLPEGGGRLRTDGAAGGTFDWLLSNDGPDRDRLAFVSVASISERFGVAIIQTSSGFFYDASSSHQLQGIPEGEGRSDCFYYTVKDLVTSKTASARVHVDLIGVKENDDEDPPNPDNPGEEEDQEDGRNDRSLTPEDKYGPGGFDPRDVGLGAKSRYIQSNRTMEYRIEFWNKEEALVPTQDAVIVDVLDPTVFDLDTLNLTRIGFLKWDVKLSGGRAIDYRVDCRPEMAIAVDVNNTFDPDTGEIRWWFHCINPLTGEYPSDDEGFLPPFNPSTGFEIGWVEFTVDLVPGLPTGTIIANQAFVEFDDPLERDPSDTFADHPAPKEGPWINTIDAGLPVSQVNPLPARSDTTDITVSWSGQDDPGGAGIAGYDIFVSENDGPWWLWLNGTRETSAVFAGSAGAGYAFFSCARDNVGHVEDVPAEPDATTVIDIEDVPSEAYVLQINNLNGLSCPEIQTTVLVTDSHGQAVTDLDAMVFSVYEDGHERPIVSAVPDNSALVASLVLDYSGTMSVVNKEDMETGAGLFVSQMGSEDSGEITKFANGVQVMQEFSHEKDALIRAINQSPGDISDNETSLYDAIYHAVSDTAIQLGSRVVLVMTDGRDSDSERTRDEVIRHAQTEGVRVFMIGLGDEIDDNVLNEIAERTGGLYCPVLDSEGLRGVFEQIYTVLNSEYTVMYETGLCGETADGRVHELEVVVTTNAASGVGKTELRCSAICDPNAPVADPKL